MSWEQVPQLGPQLGQPQVYRDWTPQQASSTSIQPSLGDQRPPGNLPPPPPLTRHGIPQQAVPYNMNTGQQPHYTAQTPSHRPTTGPQAASSGTVGGYMPHPPVSRADVRFVGQTPGLQNTTYTGQPAGYPGQPTSSRMNIPAQSMNLPSRGSTFPNPQPRPAHQQYSSPSASVPRPAPPPPPYHPRHPQASLTQKYPSNHQMVNNTNQGFVTSSQPSPSLHSGYHTVTNLNQGLARPSQRSPPSHASFQGLNNPNQGFVQSSQLSPPAHSGYQAMNNPNQGFVRPNQASHTSFQSLNKPNQTFIRPNNICQPAQCSHQTLNSLNQRFANPRQSSPPTMPHHRGPTDTSQGFPRLANQPQHFVPQPSSHPLDKAIHQDASWGYPVNQVQGQLPCSNTQGHLSGQQSVAMFPAQRASLTPHQSTAQGVTQLPHRQQPSSLPADVLQFVLGSSQDGRGAHSSVPSSGIQSQHGVPMSGPPPAHQQPLSVSSFKSLAPPTNPMLSVTTCVSSIAAAVPSSGASVVHDMQTVNKIKSAFVLPATSMAEEEPHDKGMLGNWYLQPGSKKVIGTGGQKVSDSGKGKTTLSETESSDISHSETSTAESTGIDSDEPRPASVVSEGSAGRVDADDIQTDKDSNGALNEGSCNKKDLDDARNERNRSKSPSPINAIDMLEVLRKRRLDEELTLAFAGLDGPYSTSGMDSVDSTTGAYLPPELDVHKDLTPTDTGGESGAEIAEHPYDAGMENVLEDKGTTPAAVDEMMSGNAHLPIDSERCMEESTGPVNGNREVFAGNSKPKKGTKGKRCRKQTGADTGKDVPTEEQTSLPTVMADDTLPGPSKPRKRKKTGDDEHEEDTPAPKRGRGGGRRGSGRGRGRGRGRGARSVSGTAVGAVQGTAPRGCGGRKRGTAGRGTGRCRKEPDMVVGTTEISCPEDLMSFLDQCDQEDLDKNMLTFSQLRNIIKVFQAQAALNEEYDFVKQENTLDSDYGQCTTNESDHVDYGGTDAQKPSTSQYYADNEVLSDEFTGTKDDGSGNDLVTADTDIDEEVNSVSEELMTASDQDQSASEIIAGNRSASTASGKEDIVDSGGNWTISGNTQASGIPCLEAVEQQMIYSSDTHTVSTAKFHGTPVLKLTTPEGNFYVMKQLVTKAFKIKKANRRVLGALYVIKDKYLNIPFIEIDSCIRSVVAENLRENGIINKDPKHLSIISEADALALFHAVWKKRYCGGVCGTTSITTVQTVDSEEEEGYETDSTLPYIDGNPVERLEHLLDANRDNELLNGQIAYETDTEVTSGHENHDSHENCSSTEAGDEECDDQDAGVADVTNDTTSASPLSKTEPGEMEVLGVSSDEVVVIDDNHGTDADDEECQSTGVDDGAAVNTEMSDETNAVCDAGFKQDTENCIEFGIVKKDTSISENVHLSPKSSNCKQNEHSEQDEREQSSHISDVVDSCGDDSASHTNVIVIDDTDESPASVPVDSSESDDVVIVGFEAKKENLGSEDANDKKCSDFAKGLSNENILNVAENLMKKIRLLSEHNNQSGIECTSSNDESGKRAKKDESIVDLTLSEDEEVDDMDGRKYADISGTAEEIQTVGKDSDDTIIVNTDILSMPLDGKMSPKDRLFLLQAKQQLEDCIEKANRIDPGDIGTIKSVCYNLMESEIPICKWSKTFLDHYEHEIIMEAQRKRSLDELSLTGDSLYLKAQEKDVVKMPSNPNCSARQEEESVMDRDNGD